MKIDSKDRKILYELDRDARQSNKQVARKVRLSEMVVGNRIRRLLDEGVIEYFQVKTNATLLGFLHLKMYLRLHNITSAKEKELIDELKQRDAVFWLASLRGKYDLVVSVYVRNIVDFSQRYEELFGKWKDYILERNVIVLESASSFSRIHLIPGEGPEEFFYMKGGSSMVGLDPLDSSLLSFLNRNGRAPLIEIAEKLGVGSDTIRSRMARLRKSGVITGFGVKLDHSKLGLEYSIIWLKLQNMNERKYARLKALSAMDRNATIFMRTIGDHDIELEAETGGKEELDRLIKSLRDSFVMEIKSYEILEVTREHRLTYFPF
ncbi:MAG: Lrp/AsnC family transcriptional regulator [Candidatus Bilamarchaeaceae archaeon]